MIIIVSSHALSCPYNFRLVRATTRRVRSHYQIRPRVYVVSLQDSRQTRGHNPPAQNQKIKRKKLRDHRAHVEDESPDRIATVD